MKPLHILEVLLERLENAESLDPAIRKLRRAVNNAIRPRAVRDALHGVPIGHPVHPIAAQVPLGAWLSSAFLDLRPGTDRASRRLVALGVVSAVPAALAGYTDWSELHPQQARVGILHSGANIVAVGLYSASYLQRRRGHLASGKVLGFAGLAVVAGAGFLGGHLSYRQAAGANHTEDVPHLFPSGWQRIGPLIGIPEGELTLQDVAGQPLLMLRRGERVEVVSAICSHLSGPLADGELIDGNGANPCVSCPWHKSVFELRSGEVVHGPATAPLPKFETRIDEGVLSVRLPGAG